MKKVQVFSVLVCLLFSYTAIAQDVADKTNMRVLYVGYNPEKPIPDNSKYMDWNSERFKINFISRWPVFNIYLKSRFTDVFSIDARDYKQEMSAAYDVTIFDELPPPIKEVVREEDANGQIIKYEPAVYLSDDFDHATIFVGKVGPDLGRSLGSKLDWHCYCLDADAVNIKTDHAIFNTPVKVDLTLVNKETPENFFLYPSGKNLSKQIAMWRVQGLGYIDSDYTIGMVSRGNGFLDSPDTEYISGGNNTKDIDAVALGRHGNLFLWGFSASPDHMTDEAKQVFANTIVYMKQFKGAKLIAKKMNEGVRIRDVSIYYNKRDLSVEKFKQYKKEWLAYKAKDIARIKELEQKKANGEQLSKFQEAFLKNVKPVPTLDSWTIKQIGEKNYKQFGTDFTAYKNYLDENKEYFRSVQKPSGYAILEIDEDIQKLGVSNRKIELLEKSISLLKKGSKAKTARRILTRYTEEDFASVKEWQHWLDENKGKLFFTESGGYKWLVNTTK